MADGDAAVVGRRARLRARREAKGDDPLPWEDGPSEAPETPEAAAAGAIEAAAGPPDSQQASQPLPKQRELPLAPTTVVRAEVSPGQLRELSDLVAGLIVEKTLIGLRQDRSIHGPFQQLSLPQVQQVREAAEKGARLGYRAERAEAEALAAATKRAWWRAQALRMGAALGVGIVAGIGAGIGLGAWWF
jgi:hypothetical protein